MVPPVYGLSPAVRPPPHATNLNGLQRIVGPRSTIAPKQRSWFSRRTLRLFYLLIARPVEFTYTHVSLCCIPLLYTFRIECLTHHGQDQFRYYYDEDDFKSEHRVEEWRSILKDVASLAHAAFCTGFSCA